MRDLGHDIRVMLPKYGSVSERRNRIHEINRLKDMKIDVGGEISLATVKSSSMNNPKLKVQAYITTNQNYFDSRRGFYNDPHSWELYPDNPERFIFFSRTVIDTCLLLGWFPDIIHCIGWQTALVPGLAKTLYPQKFKKTKFVFTITDFTDQGSFDKLDFKLSGLPKEAKNNYRFKNAFNFYKGGIIYSDFVTSVNASYAAEILKDKEIGNGLSSALKDKGQKFKGMKSGTDDWAWNPKIDEFITHKYDGDYLEFKHKNKADLCKKAGLKYNPDIPLIGMIAKLNNKEGIPLLIESADKLFKENIQMVLLGMGDAEMIKKLAKISAKYPDKFKMINALDDIMAHQLEAGSDMYLSLADFEHSGLNIMYSLNYGAIPVTYSKSGSLDFVIPYKDTNTGNSFVLNEATPSALLKAVKSAITVYGKKADWLALAERSMQITFSWKPIVTAYEEIYRQLTKE